mmetsp:Transcript_59030/g.172819  ORF Transcript_59030/g.172819 Transcript_59030/m.172819 type:complete len:412 (-) Transcript_59030:222-1457(-)
MLSGFSGGSSGSRHSLALGVGSQAKVQPPQRIGAALVGTGQRAREGYAPAVLQNPGFHLRALWSRTQASAERFNLEVAGCSLEVFWGDEGLQRLLARPDIEGYAVALPPSVQPSYVARILAHRRHVLSEKPVAPDRESAQETLRRLEDSTELGTVWFVSDPLRYELVFQPSHLKLHELGTLLAAEAYAVLVLDRRRDTRLRSDESLFIEGGVPHVAVLRQVLGQITEVNCVRASSNSVAERASQEGDNGSDSFWNDALSGTLRFEGGVVAAVNWQTSDSQQDERFRLTLWGTKGTATVELDMSAQAVSAGLRRFTLRRSLMGGGSAGLELPHVFASNALDRQLEAWGQAIRAASGRGSSGSAEGPRPAGEAAAKSSEQAALGAIVDLMVVGAMLHSRGYTVQIRERQRAAA